MGVPSTKGEPLALRGDIRTGLQEAAALRKRMAQGGSWREQRQLNHITGREGIGEALFS